MNTFVSQLQGQAEKEGMDQQRAGPTKVVGSAGMIPSTSTVDYNLDRQVRDSLEITELPPLKENTPSSKRRLPSPLSSTSENDSTVRSRSVHQRGTAVEHGQPSRNASVRSKEEAGNPSTESEADTEAEGEAARPGMNSWPSYILPYTPEEIANLPPSNFALNYSLRHQDTIPIRMLSRRPTDQPDPESGLQTPASDFVKEVGYSTVPANDLVKELSLARASTSLTVPEPRHVGRLAAAWDSVFVYCAEFTLFGIWWGGVAYAIVVTMWPFMLGLVLYHIIGHAFGP